MGETARYKVRVGDDGATKTVWETLPEAMAAATELAENGWNGKAQILDTVDNTRTTVKASWMN